MYTYIYIYIHILSAAGGPRHPPTSPPRPAARSPRRRLHGRTPLRPPSQRALTSREGLGRHRKGTPGIENVYYVLSLRGTKGVARKGV